jgi:predicted esterase YcpF (UPF0227 family)
MNKIKILYLHGLLSSNQSPKVDWLKKQHTVINPKLDYKNNGNTIFSELESIIIDNEVNFIVGSSMGGYLGYHLGNKLNVPTLLFNPSLAPNKIEKPKVCYVKNETVLHTVILGEYDEVVSYQNTLNYLMKVNANLDYRLMKIGHRTPFEVFVESFKEQV